MRTPLNAISGYAQLLEQDSSLPTSRATRCAWSAAAPNICPA